MVSEWVVGDVVKRWKVRSAGLRVYGGRWRKKKKSKEAHVVRRTIEWKELSRGAKRDANAALFRFTFDSHGGYDLANQRLEAVCDSGTETAGESMLLG
jgi:hypothetical protein